jgi:hypothetical protein
MTTYLGLFASIILLIIFVKIVYDSIKEKTNYIVRNKYKEFMEELKKEDDKIQK